MIGADGLREYWRRQNIISLNYAEQGYAEKARVILDVFTKIEDYSISMNSEMVREGIFKTSRNQRINQRIIDFIGDYRYHEKKFRKLMNDVITLSRRRSDLWYIEGRTNPGYLGYRPELYIGNNRIQWLLYAIIREIERVAEKLDRYLVQVIDNLFVIESGVGVYYNLEFNDKFLPYDNFFLQLSESPDYLVMLGRGSGVLKDTMVDSMQGEIDRLVKDVARFIRMVGLATTLMLTDDEINSIAREPIGGINQWSGDWWFSGRRTINKESVEFSVPPRLAGNFSSFGWYLDSHEADKYIGFLELFLPLADRYT